MSRRGQSITLSISEHDKAALEALALEFGKRWGDRPNISKLVEAIARHQLRIAPNHDWLPARIEALNLARKALTDLGKREEAREIAELLRDRSELTIPFRTEIEQFLNNPQPPWREQIDSFLHRQQPFRLSYRDAADRLWQYTVLYAEIIPIEKHQYLVCRCEESEGNQDVEGLHYNWTLRLDRIQEAAVVSLQKPWYGSLDRIPVEFHLFGRLAFAYERKPDDIEYSILEGDPPMRRVVRNIFSTYWFFREIAPYWENCEIVTPDAVRHRFWQKLRSLYQRYERNLQFLPDEL